MLNIIKFVPKLGKQFANYGDLRFSIVALSKICNIRSEKSDLSGVKSFHTCEPLNKDLRKKIYSRLNLEKVKFDGSDSIPVGHRERGFDLFPNEGTPNQLFNGLQFKDIPIVNVKVTSNNTIINLTDSNGYVKLIRSCGVEGFRNAKKGTNLAAQATAVNFGRRALDMGFKTVRVKIQGLGPGRMTAIKGLSMAGMDIISLTDNTHVSDNPIRAKKLRRI